MSRNRCINSKYVYNIFYPHEKEWLVPAAAGTDLECAMLREPLVMDPLCEISRSS
jgi:hypothetical protein